MLALFRLFFDIALLKKGPQDVPYSLFLFILIFTISFSVDILMGFVPNYVDKVVDLVLWLRFIIVANLVTIIVIYLIFRFFNQANHFLQSLTAIIGVELIMGLIRLPASILLSGSVNNEPSITYALAYLFLLLTFVWYLVVYMHIFRHGLSISRIQASMLSFTVMSIMLFLQTLLLSYES